MPLKSASGSSAVPPSVNPRSGMSRPIPHHETRAPFLCKQSPDRTLEVVILAGSLAWETSRDWRKDPDREDDIPPVVLGPDELADLDNLTIIRPDTLYVRVLRTGDIREEELLKIAVKLAHAGVQMARLMSPDGELLENWTGQLERLRQERPSDILPDHFRLDEEALWFDKLTERRDGESDVQPQRICSPLRPGRPLPRHRLSCWLTFLTGDLDASTTLARELLRRYQTALMPDNAGNQVQRIVARFALLAVAGEIATLQGITGWQEGTAYEAVRICLHAWLNERGHIANQEDEGVLAQIKRFITAHQYSRFASWDGPDRPLNMVGFRRVEKDPLTGEEHTLFFILPEGWREICRGFSPASAARLCRKQNACCPAATGNTSRRFACRRSAKPGSTGSPPASSVSECHLACLK